MKADGKTNGNFFDGITGLSGWAFQTLEKTAAPLPMLEPEVFRKCFLILIVRETEVSKGWKLEFFCLVKRKKTRYFHLLMGLKIQREFNDWCNPRENKESSV